MYILDNIDEIELYEDETSPFEDGVSIDINGDFYRGILPIPCTPRATNVYLAFDGEKVFMGGILADTDEEYLRQLAALVTREYANAIKEYNLIKRGF